MSARKFLDWRGYFEGLYLSWVKNLTNTLIALGGSNAVAQIPGLHSIGLNLQQAGTVFISITFWEVIRYVNQKPRPDTIVQDFPTETITKP